MVVPVTTKSDIQVILPRDYELSANPLSGDYRVKCKDHEGYESFSEKLSRDDGATTIKNAIMTGCDRFYDTLEVQMDSGDFNDNKIGFAF